MLKVIILKLNIYILICQNLYYALKIIKIKNPKKNVFHCDGIYHA
jgi:hypothetical protein